MGGGGSNVARMGSQRWCAEIDGVCKGIGTRWLMKCGW